MNVFTTLGQAQMQMLCRHNSQLDRVRRDRSFIPDIAARLVAFKRAYPADNVQRAIELLCRAIRLAIMLQLPAFAGD